MSDSQGEFVDGGEVSEVDRLRPGGVVDEGDPTPYADYADQTEDGAPKNYGAAHADVNLVGGEEPPKPGEDDPNA